VGKANFCFVTFPGNFKDNVGALPLAPFLNKVKVVVQNVPNYSLARCEFGNFERATTDVFVVIFKLSGELVGVTLNCL
jgi:hypothetical protein